MITIYKGNQKAVVPSGSYKSMFKPYGWTTKKPKATPKGEDRTEETTTRQQEEQGDTRQQQEEGDTAHEEQNKTPLESMSEQELRQYAALVKVNVKGLKTREELLEALAGKE